MIIKSLNFSVSFLDEFKELIEKEETLEAVIKTLDIAAKNHPALIQFKDEDTLYLVNKLKNAAYDLDRVTPHIDTEFKETATEYRYRKDLIDYLSFYLGRDTVSLFLDYTQW